MNRIAGFLCVVFVLLSLSIGKVNANGQVILDRIEPVKDDKVTFLDPLFTNSGAIENVDTGSISVTRQHELRVNVPNVILTGKEGGVDLGGSLGVLLSSAYRDVAFEAANGHVSLNANEFHFTASQNVVVESQAGDVTVNSDLQTTLHGPSINIYARDGLNIDTDGNVQFTAGTDLVVSTEDTLTFQVEGVIDIEAEKGSFYNTAGGNIGISSGDYILLDGPRGVSLDTAGQLSLVGAVAVELTGVTTDVIAKGNIAVSFPNVNVYGRDGALIGGKAVNLTSRGDLSVTGLGPQAEILFDFGNYLQLQALNGAINLETVGEATDINLWIGSQSTTLIGDDFFINTPTNIRIGGNLTDTLTIDSQSSISWNSDNTYISSDVDLYTTSLGQTKLTARDIFSRSHSYYEAATVSAITVNENSLSILSREGDPSHFAALDSAGSISSVSSNTFLFEAYSINGLFSNSQTYNVRDSTFTSTTDRDIIFAATTTETFNVEDAIDITTKVANFEGTASQTIRVDDFTINSNQFTSLNSFQHLSTLLDITLTSGQEVNFVGTTLNDVSGGVVRIDADDNIIMQVGDLKFTSAFTNKVEMQDHILYNIADLTTFSAKNTIKYDLSDSWYLKTSNFNLQGTSGITWTISEWDGVFGSLSVSSTDVATFNTKGLGYIDISSGHNLDFLAVLGINIVTGDSISSLTQEETDFQAGTSLSFTTQGDFHIQGTGDMIWHANGNILFGEGKTPTADSTINSDILRAGAGANFQIVSLDQVNFFQTNSEVDAQTDIQLFAIQGTINIANQAEPADITLFGHVIDETSSQDSFWSAGREFGFSSVDFLMDADRSIDITTSTSSIEGYTASFIGSSTSYVQGDTLYVVTGYDDYLHGSAGGTIDFTSRETQITSSSNAAFTSTGGAVTVTSKQELTFQSVLGTSAISANGPITVRAAAAGGNFGISSAEDLGFYTNTGTISHTAANTNFNTGQDFHVISQKADGALTKDCAIEFLTHDTSATFTTQVGELFLSGWEKFHVQSIIGAVGSVGDIRVQSNGNTFFESDENALAYFARGNDGFSVQTNGAHYGNVELLSAAADVWFYGSQGFKWASDQDFYILADDGMNITAAKTDPAAGTTPTISITSTDLSTIDGARGLIFVAGLDAPIVKADFVGTSSQFTNLETYDQLHVRAAGGHFQANTLSTMNIVTKEASEAKFSSARDTIMTAAQDTTYTTIDGDQYFNSNAFGINVKATEAVRVSTTDGPIQLKAIAGSFSMDGGNWEFTSQMDSRFVSLGFARLNALASLRLISSSANEGDCVLLQNYRNLDSIFVNSKTLMSVTATTNQLTPDQEFSISTVGDNIDFYAGNLLDFNSDGPMWVGNHTSPEIRITAGAGALGTGVTSSSTEGTFVRSQNTITTVANSLNYQVESGVLESTGLIYFIAQTGANNWVANDNLLMNSEFWVADAVNNHVIDGSGSATVQWVSEGTAIGDRVELHTTDVVTTESDTINYASSILYKMTLKGDYTVEAGGDISFQNIRPDDVNYPKPFFSDLQTERGKQIFSVGDTWSASAGTGDILVELGRFGTPFTTNFTTGDFQQSAISFDVNTFTWETTDFTIQAPYEGSSVKFQSTQFTLDGTGDVTLTTQVPSKTGGYVHVDPLDSNINFRSLGSFNLAATLDFTVNAGPSYGITGGDPTGSITQTSLGGTTFDFQDWAVTLGNNLQDSLIEFTSYESSVTFGSATTATLNIDSTILPSPFTNNLDTLYRNLYDSDLDTNFDYTDWSLTAGTGKVAATANTIYITPTEQLSVTARTGKFVLDTNSFESDISVTSTGSLDFTPAVTAAFGSSDLLNLHATTLGDYTGEITSFTAQWGDISFAMSTDLTFTGTDLASFIAHGFDSDNSRAISIKSNLFSLTTAADLHFEAKQAIDINSPDSALNFEAGTIQVKASNYLSPVVLNSLTADMSFVATTNNWEAGAVSLVDSHMITITANDRFDVRAFSTNAIRDSGILFDTNPLQNMQSKITLAGSTVDHTSNWLSISSDFTSADDAGIRFTSSGVGANMAIQATRYLNFLNKHGDMRFDLADANVGAATTQIGFTGGSLSWDLGTGTLTATEDTTVTTGGSIFFHTQTLQMNVDTMVLDTKQFGRSNDIYFRTASTFDAETTLDLTLLGAGSDTDIVIESENSDIFFDAVDTVSWFTRSGISVTTSEGAVSTSFDITTAQDFHATTSEYKANIFFQSDHDTMFRAPNGEIRHSRYHSRLGFFSVLPQPIKLINLQGVEGCVRARLCGARFAPIADWTSGLAYVGSIATQLHGLIRSWGLVDWTTGIDLTSYCC